MGLIRMITNSYYSNVSEDAQRIFILCVSSLHPMLQNIVKIQPIVVNCCGCVKVIQTTTENRTEHSIIREKQSDNLFVVALHMNMLPSDRLRLRATGIPIQRTVRAVVVAYVCVCACTRLPHTHTIPQGVLP